MQSTYTLDNEAGAYNLTLGPSLADPITTKLVHNLIELSLGAVMTPPSALIFDVNETLLDLSSAKPALAKLFGDDRAAVEVWFSTLLHHSLVESAIGGKHNFSDIAVAAAQIVAQANGISLSSENAKNVITESMTTLAAYDDALTALKALRNIDIKLIALSNSSTCALDDQLAYSRLAEYFDYVLSVEEVGIFKPHAEVYQWACKQISIEPKNCMMVAAHGWDIAGAAAAGLQTAFVAREGKCQYPLAPKASVCVEDIEELVSLLN
ncbi:haloacid dehalogenase type II [Alteromonas sp. ASW11-130]|uniref:haloacid dehalogenase type II n=1 Tax=Alteromonas sp. ASW11-130 TaxID=3015775 RepID=UPI00224230B5|nr:haloacid dehalogenase type II [Alteromonas sp. ASW11-130]MCW8091204.1 haloacid dehalogenase type II [Alteromonas sp. ASW11-130]